MKKILLVFLLIVCNRSFALQKNESYADSVRGIITYILGQQQYWDTAIILENTAFNSIDSMLFLDNPAKEYVFMPTTRVGGTGKSVLVKKEIFRGNKYTATNSIKLSEKELKHIIDEWHHPRISKWDARYFPKNKLVSQYKTDSFFHAYSQLIENYSAAIDNINSEGGSKRFSDLVQGLESTRKSSYYVKGHWKVSAPVFLRKGKFAVVTVYLFMGMYSLSYHIRVYERTTRGWEQFGIIYGGEYN